MLQEVRDTVVSENVFEESCGNKDTFCMIIHNYIFKFHYPPSPKRSRRVLHETHYMKSISYEVIALSSQS